MRLVATISLGALFEVGEYLLVFVFLHQHGEAWDFFEA